MVKNTLIVIININYGYRTFRAETRKYSIFNRIVKDCLHSDEKEDVAGALDRLTRVLQRIDVVLEEIMDLLMAKATLEEVRAWSKSSKEELTSIKVLRRELKAKLDSLENLEQEKKNYNWKSIHNVRFK